MAQGTRSPPRALCGETAGGAGDGSGAQAEDQAKASLADTGRCNGRSSRQFQMLEDFPDDLLVRDGRDHPQRPQV